MSQQRERRPKCQKQGEEKYTPVITTVTTESRTYFAYAKDVIDHYVIDRKRLDLCVKEKRLIDIPKEEEILAMTEEIKKDPQKFRISA